jgi:hypothetical protein
MSKLPLIEVGFQVFASDGGDVFGAVRDVAPGGRPEIVVYVENSGDFSIPLLAVQSVHSQKVVVDAVKLDPRVRAAIQKAHASEDR